MPRSDQARSALPLYFAYGSNMSTPRLRQRVSVAATRGVASLRGHSLRFHKLGKDGSGRADAVVTGNLADVVFGVLFELSNPELERLDRVEGRGYVRATRELSLPNDTSAAAFAYFAVQDSIVEGLLPTASYLEYIVAGALEHGLPVDYIEALERIPTWTRSLPSGDSRPRHG